MNLLNFKDGLWFALMCVAALPLVFVFVTAMLWAYLDDELVVKKHEQAAVN